MTMSEYKEMYAEFCAETGERGSPDDIIWKKSFEEFVAWRKRVEAFFDKNRKENV